MPDRRLICLLGLDTVREKTLYQTRALHARGWSVDVLTLHRNAGSIRTDPSARIVAMESGGWARLRQVVRYLLEKRDALHHVELYVGGRFAVVLALLCRLLRVRVVVVERGDLLMCLHRRYPLSMRLSVYACYVLAHRIWFKEIYMRPFFSRWRRRSSHFLPNAVPTATEPPVGQPRDIDLLWVNRLIPERHPDWFADAVTNLATTSPVSVTVIGLLDQDEQAEHLQRLEQHVVDALRPLPRTTCLSYTDPRPYYLRARFFVLPADVVFGNYALLEAMAAGVVPVVFAAEGVEEVVRHRREGLVSAADPASLLTALEEATAMDEASWSRLSQNARHMVASRYSLDGWTERLIDFYDRVRPPGTTAHEETA
jgi:glycosyltransferase involved in cell wall biosynthesis